ncbi:MAG: PAS domain S-box protein [Candidatus Abyssobacteria bacterium SURF_5]|uniref:histidine kinase n=1 Tax=Abyssobacteria bacterium (strain SURF_5) TaxID=2093360 RepID=A0A3A4NE32_ABYX5|nr:MAG: PAS domain S-box protein [Candidatus Abyssubacteria bacterium SURF_5]
MNEPKGGGAYSPAPDILSIPSPKWIKCMFESFIDSIDIGIFVLDCNGVINRVNKSLLDQYRLNTEELLGRNIFELMPDLADLGVEKRFRQIIGERKSLELTNVQRRDRFGRNIVFNIKGIPIIEDDDIVGILAVMSDITEKRALESQVAETEEYLHNLIDNANDIIYTLDLDGYITFLNKMGQQVTGYQFDPKERAHYSAYVPENTLQKNDRHFQEALAGRPQRYESTIIGSDGKIVNVLTNISTVRKDEKVVGVLGIARDITERKQMEAQLLQAGKMAAIGELAAGVAHEINNPVAIISGTAEQLLFLMNYYRERPQDMTERLAKHVETIHEQAARCKKITQGLLNFARKTETHTTIVNLPKLLEETVALVDNRALAEGKAIQMRLDHDVSTIEADPYQLEQVFLNMVNNAVDAVAENGTITLEARRKKDAVVVKVIDDGIGISEQNIKKIFDPFFTTKPPGKGTGLGLSICFGIIQSMNGTISVKSKPGAGTTFTITLPMGRNDPK